MILERQSAKNRPSTFQCRPAKTQPRWILLVLVMVLAFSYSGCSKDAKSRIVGKWEATITGKGGDAKVLWEFLPDGTFQCAPLVDPTTIVDRDKYEIIDEGRRVKLRSQLLPSGCILTLEGSTMTCDSPEAKVRFKKL
jgi:hypothetical protein